MTSPIYIGIDNGVSGTIAVLASEGRSWFWKTPIRKRFRDFQKEEKRISRIDSPALLALLEPFATPQTKVFVERPLINPGRFAATISAARAWEATLVVLETLKLEPVVIDSRQWQKLVFPASVKAERLKTESLARGLQYFPEHAALMKKHGDADSLLMARWARMTGR